LLSFKKGAVAKKGAVGIFFNQRPSFSPPLTIANSFRNLIKKFKINTLTIDQKNIPTGLIPFLGKSAN